MQQDSTQLLRDLEDILNNSIQQIQAFKHMSSEQLNYRAHAKSWSILECLEHLNLYGDFYLPEMERAIIKSGSPKVDLYKSGWLGNYFADLMRAEKGKKMASPKDKNPIYSALNETTVIRFEKQAERLKHILDLAKNANLNKVKCSISISRFIKLKLGDTLRFYLYHIDRHIQQAAKIQPE
jgi:hypothetical protein